MTIFGGDNLKIAICDDEQLYVDNIIKHLDYFSVNNCIDFEKYVFISPDELLLCEVNFDIAILDVEMKSVNGIELGEKLRNRLPHIVLIYITAHKKYLDDALNLNAARFFEKPLDSQRFYRGLSDAIKRIDNSTISFFVKDRKSMERISTQDIVFVEIEKRKTRVVIRTKEYTSEHHISFWQDNLTSSMFFSPHKSYIINFNYVTTYERDYVILNGTYKINIARKKQADFYQKFMKFAEGK